MNKTGKTTQRLTMIAMMLALVMALTFLEHSLPPLPLLPPGVKFGLSNVVTMFVLFFAGRKAAFGLAAAKSLFVLLTRGFTAGMLSFCGGMLALLAIVALCAVSHNGASMMILSVTGAVAHNLGQIAAASFLVRTSMLWYYLPVLIAAGVVMGSLTAALLRAAMPALRRAMEAFEKAGPGKDGPEP